MQLMAFRTNWWETVIGFFFMISTRNTIKILFFGEVMGSSLKRSILAVHTACLGAKIREHGADCKVTWSPELFLFISPTPTFNLGGGVGI